MEKFIRIRDEITESAFFLIKDQIESKSKGYKVKIIKKDSFWDDGKNISIENLQYPLI